ncbi:hypothetical protein [Brevundimonas subvibrioides]|nr:hypothetical protein [Brevundimonas subvibrioides]
MFLIEQASRADQTRKIAREALGKTDPDDDPEPTQKALKRFSRTNSENLVNNSVNAFQRYFSQIVQECIRKKPDILTSNEQVPVRDIIHLKRMSDVIELLVERRVNKLAYEGISGIESYFLDRLGLAMFSNDRERQLTREFIELRNIIVHNGGIVNAIFLERVGSSPTRPFRLGKRYHIGWDDFCDYAANIIAVTSNLDKAACTKFSLRRKKFGTWVDLKKS